MFSSLRDNNIVFDTITQMFILVVHRKNVSGPDIWTLSHLGQCFNVNVCIYMYNVCCCVGLCVHAWNVDRKSHRLCLFLGLCMTRVSSRAQKRREQLLWSVVCIFFFVCVEHKSNTIRSWLNLTVIILKFVCLFCICIYYIEDRSFFVCVCANLLAFDVLSHNGVSNISTTNVSNFLSLNMRKKNKWSKHLRLIERSAGSRSSSCAKRPSSPACLIRQCSSRQA